MRDGKVAPTATRQRNLQAAAWLFAISLFGYPVIGNMVDLFHLDSRTLSVPFRVAVGLFALWTFALPGRLRIDPWRALLLFILGAYAVRLGYDMHFAEIAEAEYALQLFLVGALLPAIAICRLNAYDDRAFAKATLVVAFSGCLLSLLGHYSGALGEADLTEATGRLSSVALNPVSLGYLSVSGLFAALVLWPDGARSTRFLLGCASVILLGVLLLTGSKGPVAVLVLALALWALRRGLVLKVTLLGALFVAALVLTENPVAVRIAAGSEDLSTLDRIDLIEASVRQIAQGPWFGSAFIELESGFYAHNIFLEAAMSFGLPLTAALGLVLARGVVLSWRCLDRQGQFLSLIFFLGVTSAIISSSIYGAAVLWICLLLILDRRGSVPHQRTKVGALDLRPRSSIASFSTHKQPE